jgi:hypothetical protein
MAPGLWPLHVGDHLLGARQDNAAGAPDISSPENVLLREQWRDPKDILSVLLLLAPNIVQFAVAQTVGYHVTPVAFSFGWVANSAGALMRTFGGECGVNSMFLTPALLAYAPGDKTRNRRLR